MVSTGGRGSGGRGACVGDARGVDEVQSGIFFDACINKLLEYVLSLCGEEKKPDGVCHHERK